MRSLTLLPSRTVRFLHRYQFLAVLLSGLILAFSIGIANAQVADDDFSVHESQTAFLSVYVDHPHRLSISLYEPDMEDLSWLNEADLEPAMQAAVGCDVNSWQTHLDLGISVWGQCDRLLQKDWGWQGQLNLSPLLSLLQPSALATLEVTVDLPSMGQSEFSPVGIALLDEYPQAEQMNWSVPHHSRYDINIAQPQVTQIDYRYGFTARRVAIDIIGLATVLLASLVTMVWLQQRALKAHASAQAAGKEMHIWFGYQRCSVWLETVTWFAWITALTASAALFWQALFLPAGVDEYGLTILSGAQMLLPPLLLGLLNRTLSHAVMTKVGRLTYTFLEVIGQYLAAQGTLLSFLLTISMLPLVLVGQAWAGVVLPLALLSMFACLRVSKKLKDWTPHAITTGELRDRVFSLAKPAGVTLTQLYLLPMKRSRMLNAFAVKNDTVMVTDYLLKHLSKAEVDGVMAHEIAHLQLGHPRKLLWQLIVVGVLTTWGIQLASAAMSWFLPAAPALVALQIPVAPMIVFGSFFATSRRFEYQADAQGVLLTGNPQAAITGLVKLTCLNQVPMQWGKVSESLMTHPSLQRRVDAIAKRHDLPETEVAALVAQATSAELPTKDYYALDASLTDGHPPLFSVQLQQKLCLRLLVAMTACFTLLPSLLAWLVQLLPTAGLRWFGYGVAAGGVVAVSDYVRNVGPTWGFGKLRKNLAARLVADGFDPSQGTFVGFSPSEELRTYGGCTEWDVGFLFTAGSRLCYIGERVQFAIASHQITQLSVQTDKPSGVNLSAIALTWQAEDLSAQTYRFQPIFVRAARQTKPASVQLCNTLHSWRTAAEPVVEPNALFRELEAPRLGTVTSQPLSPFNFGLVLFGWAFQLMLATAFSTIFLYSDVLNLFPLLMATVGTILQSLPALRRTTS